MLQSFSVIFLNMTARSISKKNWCFVQKNVAFLSFFLVFYWIWFIAVFQKKDSMLRNRLIHFLLCFFFQNQTDSLFKLVDCLIFFLNFISCKVSKKRTPCLVVGCVSSFCFYWTWFLAVFQKNVPYFGNMLRSFFKIFFEHDYSQHFKKKRRPCSEKGCFWKCLVFENFYWTWFIAALQKRTPCSEIGWLVLLLC